MSEQGYTDILACDKAPTHDTHNIEPTKPPFRTPESIDVSRFMKNENFLSEPVSNKTTSDESVRTPPLRPKPPWKPLPKIPQKPTPTLTTHQQIKNISTTTTVSPTNSPTFRIPTEFQVSPPVSHLREHQLHTQHTNLLQPQLPPVETVCTPKNPFFPTRTHKTIETNMYANPKTNNFHEPSEKPTMRPTIKPTTTTHKNTVCVPSNDPFLPSTAPVDTSTRPQNDYLVLEDGIISISLKNNKNNKSIIDTASSSVIYEEEEHKTDILVTKGHEPPSENIKNIKNIKNNINNENINHIRKNIMDEKSKILLNKNIIRTHVSNDKNIISKCRIDPINDYLSDEEVIEDLLSPTSYPTPSKPSENPINNILSKPIINSRNTILSIYIEWNVKDPLNHLPTWFNFVTVVLLFVCSLCLLVLFVFSL